MNQSFKKYGGRGNGFFKVAGLMALLIATVSLSGCQQTGLDGAAGEVEKDSAKKTGVAMAVPIAVATESSAGEIKWGQQIGTASEDLGLTIAVDQAGNSYVAGFTSGDAAGKNQGYNDLLVAKYDPAGKVLWQLQNGTEDDESAVAMVLNKAGDVYITGSTYGSFGEEAGEGKLFVQKINTDGKILWTKQYGGPDRGASQAIHLDAQENVYIGGSTSGQLGEKYFGSTDAVILKLSADGQVIWTCQWGTEENDEVKGLEIDEKGQIYATGDTAGALGHENEGGNDIFYSQISPEGKILKSYQYGTVAGDTATSLVVNAEQEAYLAAWTEGEWAGKAAGQGDSVLLKVDAAGMVLWEKQFGTPLWDGIHSVIFDKTDPTSVIVGGCENYADCHAFLIKVNSEGNMVWNKTLIPEFSTCGRVVAMDSEGNLYQTGGTHGQLYGDKAFEGTDSDLFIYKLPAVK